MLHCFLSFVVLVIIILNWGTCSLPGHMKPLGSHLPPLDIDTLQTIPDPLSFYFNYVKPNKPVKFKGLLKNHRAIKYWQDDDYLRENFGESMIGIESGKKENRSNYGSDMRFSEFLDKYKTEDIYAVTELPTDMLKEWPIPPFLLCGGYTQHLSLFYLWFSSGGTKSVLHTDSFENLHCVVSGHKMFVLIESNYSTLIGPEYKSQRYYNLDVEAVDMNKYPALATIPWYKVIVEPGDCLYLPFEWIHHVDSSGRNMGVNLWWIPFDFKESECSGDSVTDFASAADFQRSPELEIKWFLMKCKRDDNTIHASDVHDMLKENTPVALSVGDITKMMEILLPGSNGLIHANDLALDKTPATKYQAAMEYITLLHQRHDAAERDNEADGVEDEQDDKDSHASRNEL